MASPWTFMEMFISRCPFAVRLNNGMQYTFSEPRNFGAPKDFREIFYFGDSEWVLIDLESITEIIRR